MAIGIEPLSLIRAGNSSFWMSSGRVELALWLSALPNINGENGSQIEECIGKQIVVHR